MSQATKQSRDAMNAEMRRSFAQLMAAGGVTSEMFEASTEAYQAHVETLKAEDAQFPPVPVRPMPTVEVPQSAVVILAHRRDPEGLGMLVEAMASAHVQTANGVQVVVQDAKEWWPEKVNEAVARTHGEYLTLLCYDDRLNAPFMAKTQAVARASGADLVYTDRWAFSEGREPKLVKSPRIIRKEMFEYGNPLPFTTLIRRAWWDRMGGFDGTLALCNNDFYFRSVVAGAVIAHLPEPLVEYREHAQQGHRTLDLNAHYAALYAKWHALELV